VRNLNLK